jgi:IS605 OrfB family transposase
MNNFLNQSVNIIIKRCLSDKIGNIVIGQIKGIKQNALLGKKNNQHFQSLPFSFFKRKLKGKCELYGINYIETEESYTSQTCCQCGQIRKANRKHRGLYVCKQCKQIANADSNGAINIIKKVFPEFQIGDSSVVNTPVCMNIIS